MLGFDLSDAIALLRLDDLYIDTYMHRIEIKRQLNQGKSRVIVKFLIILSDTK